MIDIRIDDYFRLLSHFLDLLIFRHIDRLLITRRVVEIIVIYSYIAERR